MNDPGKQLERMADEDANRPGEYLDGWQMMEALQLDATIAAVFQKRSRDRSEGSR